MASFLRCAAPLRREWSLEDAALFAARKEFELLKLLSTDKKALATARRLGFMFGHTQAQPLSSAVPAGDAAVPRPTDAAGAAQVASSAARSRARQRPARRAQPAERAPTQSHTHSPAAAVGAAAAATPVVLPVASDLQAAGTRRANAKTRRRAARSARRHAARRRLVHAAATAVLFFLKLRRRVRRRRAAAGLMELSSPTSSASASSKRGRSHSPASRCAGSSAGRTPPSAGSYASCGPEPEECADGGCGSCARCAREGRREHLRLRRGALAMLLAPQ